MDRVLQNCAAKSSDLERYIFLMALQDQNKTLFYHTILTHLKDVMPIIYTRPLARRRCTTVRSFGGPAGSMSQPTTAAG